MKKKMSLEELEVISFQTKGPDAHVGGLFTWECVTNYQNCDTANVCETDGEFCFATQQVNCTGNCTYIC